MRLFKILLPVALISLVLFLGFYNLTGNLMKDDKGPYLYASWRISLGETPYRDFFVSQTPLSFYVTAALFKAFMPDILWARAACLLLILATGFLIYRAASRLFDFGRGLSLGMAAVFLLTKQVYSLGRSFMPDCYMIFFCATALYLGLKGEDPRNNKGEKTAVFLFGIFSGLAALSKASGILLPVGYLFYLIYLLIRKIEKPQDAARKAFLASAGFALSFGLIFVFMLVFVPGTYHSTIGFHMAKEKIAAPALLTLPFLRLGQFLGNHNYGLIPVALIGLFFGPVSEPRKRALLVSAALAFLGLAFLPGEFYPRYVVFALVPLTIFFGAGIKCLYARKKLQLFVFPIAAFLVLLCLGPTLNPKRLAERDTGTRTLAAFVRDQTAPGEYVFGDDPAINFYAGRPCPPRLVDVSGAMTKSGQITAADIRSECEARDVRLVFVEKGHSAHHLRNLKDYPLFESYLQEHYEFVKTIRREFLEVDIYKKRPGP